VYGFTFSELFASMKLMQDMSIEVEDNKNDQKSMKWAIFWCLTLASEENTSYVYKFKR